MLHIFASFFEKTIWAMCEVMMNEIMSWKHGAKKHFLVSFFFFSLYIELPITTSYREIKRTHHANELLEAGVRFQTNTKALFASLERKGRRLEKKWISGRNKEKWEGRTLGVNFLHNTKLSSFGGIHNLCCYNVFKIKNIVIICINLSFSKKLLFLKIWKIFSFPLIFSTRQSLLFPSPPNKA